MGYSSRRPHRVPLLSANKKRRLQFTQTHQSWTIEDWKNVAWSDESRFLMQHSDVRVRICRKEHESIDTSCLVPTVQAGGGGVTVWGIFSWHTLGPLVPIEHRLNATAYLNIVADHVYPLWLQCTHLLMTTSSTIMHGVTKLKSSQTGFLNMTVSSLYQMASTVIRSQSNRSPLSVVEREIHIMDVHPTNLQQLCDVIMSIWTKISEECLQHLVESMPWRIKEVLKAKAGPTRY